MSFLKDMDSDLHKMLMKVDKYFEIDEENLEKDLSRFSSVYGYFSTKLAKYQSLMEKAKFELGKLQAELDSAYRSKFREEGTKFTEKMIESSIITDERYIDKQEFYQNLREVFLILQKVVDSLSTKKDMLISLVSMKRIESSME